MQYKKSRWKISLSLIRLENCLCDVIKCDVINSLIFYNIARKHKTKILHSYDFWPLKAFYLSKILAFPERSTTSFVLTCHNSWSFCHSKELFSALSSSHQGLSNSIFLLEKRNFMSRVFVTSWFVTSSFKILCRSWCRNNRENMYNASSYAKFGEEI